MAPYQRPLRNLLWSNLSVCVHDSQPHPGCWWCHAQTGPTGFRRTSDFRNHADSQQVCYLRLVSVDVTNYVRTGIQWTTLFCVYFVMCGQITQWPSEFNTSIHRLIGDIFFVTVIWWNLSSFEHLHFLIYPKCTFVRTTAFSLLSMNNYTVL